MTEAPYRPDQTAIAVIPARGGSKGIPRKNLAPLLGTPMLAYTIRAAQAVPQIGEVLVSTNDEEISRYGASQGATVVPRPEELARDDSPTEPCIVHALDWWLEHRGVEPDWVALLQPTAPLRTASDIEAAFEALRETGADSVLSVVERREFHWRLEGNRGVPAWDIENRPRRQELVPDYVENGAIYITRTRLYREKNNRLGGRIALTLMPQERSVDVDDPSDLVLVENLLKNAGTVG